MTAWLRQGEHDALIKLAKEQDRTVSSLVREFLKLKVPARTE